VLATPTPRILPPLPSALPNDRVALHRISLSKESKGDPEAVFVTALLMNSRIFERFAAVTIALYLGAIGNPLRASDPLLPYLDGKATEIIREITNSITPPEGVVLRQVVFRSRDNSEIYAVIASPMAAGKHPGILVLHGGGGSAEVKKAMSWAQRGYVAVAPDLPGIAKNVSTGSKSEHSPKPMC